MTPAYAYLCCEETWLHQVNEFRVEGILGTGSFGNVFKGVDTLDSHGTAYAIKVLSRNLFPFVVTMRCCEQVMSKTKVRKQLGRFGNMRQRASTVSGRVLVRPRGRGATNQDPVQLEIAVMKLLDHPNVVRLHKVRK